MRSRSLLVAPATLSILALVSLLACGGDNAGAPPSSSHVEDDGGGSGPGVDAGTEGEGGSVIIGHGPGDDASVEADGAPSPCPADAVPAANPCVLDEAYGVFVVSNAAPGGDGTRAKPFMTLTAGIAAAKAAKKRVYACAGTYAETIELQNGVSMFGAFACTANVWTLAATHARVQSPTSPAARATGITAATMLEGIDLVAPDFGGLAADSTEAAKSSIALLASASPGLTVRGAVLHAGTGQAGANGTDGAVVTQTSNYLDGFAAFPPRRQCFFGTCQTTSQSATGGASGGESICKLADGTATPATLNGGSGGRAGYPAHYAWVTVPREPGSDLFIQAWRRDVLPGDGSPLAANATTAAGAPRVAQGAVVNNAANGAAVAAGANGASVTSLGSLSAMGFSPSDGATATNGSPGQGGGGGAGLDHRDTGDGAVVATAPPNWFDGATGSGGGAGGCAGLAGTAGRSGGASLAIVAIDSPLRVESTTLETSAAGSAGRGGKGSSGTPGGSAGAPWRGPSGAVYGSSGGAGSAGTAGGAGGSGRGGHSIAIAYTGVMPTVVSPTYKLGAAGAGAASFTTPTGTIAASLPGAQAQTQKF